MTNKQLIGRHLFFSEFLFPWGLARNDIPTLFHVVKGMPVLFLWTILLNPDSSSESFRKYDRKEYNFNSSWLVCEILGGGMDIETYMAIIRPTI